MAIKATTIKVKKLRPDAVMPVRTTEGAACFDLAIADTVNLLPIPAGNKPTIVGTGLAMEIPQGYHLKIHLRSGMAAKTKIRLANGTGIIDSDYRGEIGLILENIGTYTYQIEAGTRVAQCELCKNTPVKFEEVTATAENDLSKTERGTGGFGSTGTKEVKGDNDSDNDRK